MSDQTDNQEQDIVSIAVPEKATYNKAELEDKIEKVMLILIQHRPFYASIIIQMSRTITTSVDTMGVSLLNGRMQLYMNPFFIQGLRLDQLAAVMEHECLHLIFLHFQRRDGRDMKMWNIATDLAINSLITDMFNRRTHGNFSDILPFALYPTQFNLEVGLTSEEYYRLVLTKLDSYEISFHKTYSEAKAGGEEGDNASGNQNGNGNQESEDGSGGEAGGEEGDNADGDTGGWVRIKNRRTGEVSVRRYIHDESMAQSSETEDGSLDDKIIRDVVAKAKDKISNEQFGRLPAEIQRKVEELLAPPKVNWRKMLRNYVAASIKSGSKSSWKRVNRRFGEDVKGRVPDRACRIVLVVDTSGSIGQFEYQLYMSEVMGIMRAYKAEATVIECDADIGRTYKIQRNKTLDVEFTGGGGTDFRPPFKYTAEHIKDADVLIYFTDMYGSFPEPSESYRFKTIWVSVSKGMEKSVPFGRYLEIDVEEEKKKAKK